MSNHTTWYHMEKPKMKNQSNDIGVTAAGSATGAIGAVTAVSACGIPGLGATGITSGLAAIGSIGGGGMALGLVICCSTPLACGAIAYGLYKWLKSENV